MHVLFWINKHRVNARGEAPLMLRITHHNKRINVSTDVKLKPDQWDSKKQRAKGTSTLTQEVNNLISKQRGVCFNLVGKMLEEGKPFSAFDLSEAVKGADKPEVGWLELFDTHIKHMEARIGVDFTRATITRYDSSRKNLKHFIQQEHKKSDLYLSRVDRSTIADFDQFLRGTMKFTNNYVIKTMQQVKKVFRTGIVHGYVQHDPFDSISYKKTETTKDYLYDDELKKLITWETEDTRMATTKDIFLFMCYTGLAHADARKASIDDITIDNHNRPWLILRRTKNNNLVQIPLLHIVSSIISKYDASIARTKHRLLLPVPCNQVLNRNLKDLAAVTKIKKHLCSHSGRYTYASTVLLGNGVRVEVAQKLLAHNSIKSTMIYGKLTQQAIVGDLMKLEDKLHLEHEG